MFVLTTVNASRNQNIIFLIVSLVLFAVAGLIIYLYIKKIKNEKENRSDLLAEKKTINQIFRFWSHLIYLFLIFTAVVGGLVLFSVSVGGTW